MYILQIFLCLILAYLAGSINFAILITRWVKGIDIRSVGNKNPGTSNVGRMVGKGWAALVFAGDFSKGLIPLILARILFFQQEHQTDYFPLFLTGMMAVTGHCFPLFHKFRGGGGLATSIGVYLFFVPVEFLATLIVSFLIVLKFYRKKKYSYGQITPMFFVAITPFFVLLSNLFFDKNPDTFICPGGHPWYVITGVASLSVYISMINLRIIRRRILKKKPSGRQGNIHNGN